MRNHSSRNHSANSFTDRKQTILCFRFCSAHISTITHSSTLKRSSGISHDYFVHENNIKCLGASDLCWYNNIVGCWWTHCYLILMNVFKFKNMQSQDQDVSTLSNTSSIQFRRHLDYVPLHFLTLVLIFQGMTSLPLFLDIALFATLNINGICRCYL